MISRQWKKRQFLKKKLCFSREKATSNPLFRTGRQMQKREPERSQPYSGKDIVVKTGESHLAHLEGVLSIDKEDVKSLILYILYI